MPKIDQKAMAAAMQDWARALLERVDGHELALVGLIRHGDVLARRLVAQLEAAGCHARYGALDISLYRDDFSSLSEKPALHSSYLPFSTDGMHLVLVDDVVYTGRTIRAALNAIFDYGRPARVELHCLVDKGGRELPIQPDYAAFLMESPEADVTVHLAEVDGVDEIITQTN